jgi:hypothetical protein
LKLILQGGEPKNRKGELKPYVHQFKKSEPGRVDLIQKSEEIIQTSDIFQDFLNEVDLERNRYQVRLIRNPLMIQNMGK